MKNIIRLGAIIIILTAVQVATAQTPVFTYQGRLTDNSADASGTYQMQFALFDAAAGGAQIGSVIERNTVTVTNGIFTVQLDFGANAFSGADRFLQISVRRNSGEGYTALNPRQKIDSAPYAIKSLTAANADNAQNLGGAAANQFVQTNDPRLSDARTPLAGSGNYIQNTTTQQVNADFNVDGTGTANVLNATTQFNLNNQRILTAATSNLFAGIGAGQSNTLGTNNSFFGFNAGLNNTGNEIAGGRFNSFFGSNAGQMLTQSRSNSFFGYNAGGVTTSANNSSFFGAGAGSNSNGDNNSFFGTSSGRGNDGNDNSFFGFNAGQVNIGTRNSFFGYESGRQSVFGVPPGFSGNDNAFFGWSAGRLNLESDNSFFGSLAGSKNTVGAGNTFVGMSAGGENVSGSNNTFVGRNTGGENVSGSSNTLVGSGAGINSTGSSNSVFGAGAGQSITTGSNNTLLGANTNVTTVNQISFATAIGAGAIVRTSDTIALGRENGADTVRIFGLGTAGSTTLCRNASNQISTCSSSRRYKSNIRFFADGLNLLNKLNPVSFNWNTSDQADIGLIAEEVAEVEPRLTYKNQNGEIEGISYPQLNVVLINAVKQQQEQIEEQKAVIHRQAEKLNQMEADFQKLQTEIEALKKLFNLSNPARTHEPQNEEKSENEKRKN